MNTRYSARTTGFRECPDLKRRQVVRGLGGLLAGGALLPAFAASSWTPRIARASSLFTLGVASGDPGGDRVHLWTRLASDPLNGGGMGSAPVEIEWRLATDPDMKNVIRGGSVTAQAESAHSAANTNAARDRPLTDRTAARPGRRPWGRRARSRGWARR